MSDRTHKAPSAGMKVTTGDRPVTREAPGSVPGESLAAESARKGGAFAENVGMEQGPQKRSTQQQPHQTKSRAGTGEGSTAANKTTTLNLESQQTSRGTATAEGAPQKTGQMGAGEGQVLGVTTDKVTPGGGDMPKRDLRALQQEPQGQPAPTYVANQYIRNLAPPHGKNLKEGGFEGSGTEGGPLPEPGSMEDPARVAERDLKAKMASQGRDAGPRQTGGVEGKSWYTPLEGDEPA